MKLVIHFLFLLLGLSSLSAQNISINADGAIPDASAILDLSDTTIRKKLSSKLPKYMLPNKIKKVETIPRNANGKIDRQGLLLEFS